ncbi:MAG: cytochrome oxidase small assembly protein [Burkholderiales bacterium]
MDEQQAKKQRAKNLRTGLILLCVVLAFFAGIIWRRWA